jgi:hypothetical protein
MITFVNKSFHNENSHLISLINTNYMSKLNIIGIIKSIKSKSNIYTPIIEAIVNAIDSIYDSENNKNGKISIIVKRDHTLRLDDTKPIIKSIEIIDNGIGFIQKIEILLTHFIAITK